MITFIVGASVADVNKYLKIRVIGGRRYPSAKQLFDDYTYDTLPDKIRATAVEGDVRLNVKERQYQIKRGQQWITYGRTFFTSGADEAIDACENTTVSSDLVVLKLTHNI